jgi:hypothetical protein
MASIKTAEENPRGLHQKYIVSHSSGKPVDPDAVYFVLRLDGTHLHNWASRKAAEKWAACILAEPEGPLTQTAREVMQMVAAVAGQESVSECYGCSIEEWYAGFSTMAQVPSIADRLPAIAEGGDRSPFEKPFTNARSGMGLPKH